MNDKEPFAHKRLLIILIFLTAIVVSALLLARVLMPVPATRFSLRAVIVDQLGSEFPNPDFGLNGKVAIDMKNAGFDVSYVGSEAVNVDFYTKLAGADYGIIIVRAHSAMRVDSSIVDFFTSETYSSNRYRSYQQDGRVTMGSYSWRPNEYFFAVSPDLIKNLDGTFPKSIVIAMGCNGLNTNATEMAEAFVQKGALAYIGWSGLVSASHTDNETIKLIEGFLNGNKTIRESVLLTTPDSSTPDNSYLDFRPAKAENLTKNDLLADAEGSTVLYGLSHSSENELSGLMFSSLAILVARRLQVYLCPDLYVKPL